MPQDMIHVLLVEDNPGDARLVLEMLKEEGAAEFALTHVTTVRAALELLLSAAQRFDVILLDLSLPDESGLNTIRRVAEVASHLVVVVMTGAGDEEVGLAAMQEGAQDYLVKGQVDGRMLRRALRFAVQRGDVRRQLQTLSLNDDLTGLNNRRGFLMLAEQQLKHARRTEASFLLLFVDLDRLKFINDTIGHSEGNRAIREVADVLRACFRHSDILGRIGGDEFAVLAISANAQDEPAVRGRLMDAVDRLNTAPDRAYSLGISVGIVAGPPDGDTTIEALLEHADGRMYREKSDRKRVGA